MSVRVRPAATFIVFAEARLLHARAVCRRKRHFQYSPGQKSYNKIFVITIEQLIAFLTQGIFQNAAIARTFRYILHKMINALVT